MNIQTAARTVGEGAEGALILLCRRILPALGRLLTRFVLSPFYRAGTKLIARVIWRPTVIGFEKLPKKGAALLISNHVSYLDGFLLYAMSERPIRFIIDEDIFNLPMVHYFMTLARAIPLKPNREGVTRMLAEVASALKNGELVCIFPEGTLTRTGSLGRFKPGIEWIVKHNPVPVIPMAITGLWGSIFSRKYHKSRFWWWPRRLRSTILIVCGDPMPPEQVTVNLLQREVLRLKYVAAEGAYPD